MFESRFLPVLVHKHSSEISPVRTKLVRFLIDLWSEFQTADCGAAEPPQHRFSRDCPDGSSQSPSTIAQLALDDESCPAHPELALMWINDPGHNLSQL
jgi:hypothetical protein